MDFDTWITFFAATVAISLSPGPGAIAAMGAGLNHGFRHGQPIAFGLLLGVCTQTLVVGLGLGVLLSTSELAFSVVKWVGAAYLIWLGIQQWRSPASPVGAPGAPAARPARRTLVLRGWGINALNPKGTVFLLAVLPQFIDVARPLLDQYLLITATFGVVECVVMSAYVALASRVLGLLRSPRQIRWMNRSFGGLFVLAGTVLGLFRRGA
ncbi:homoserine/homoserine lactone efflux protein [Sphaerotilus hippei]|uniref:Homoserine/homoserine lactone efflux protein n=1 Tax=Sphaerotilus hippei TaxID=744406 RepID=A0A318H154_9BURK|nr:LysE family transporter [Sphaerotilus hippei]PXW96655.1 homoserine/homoserine lactone efflux protein [Sphaerotilus hippei]